MVTEVCSRTHCVVYVSIQYCLLLGENLWQGGCSWNADGRVKQTLGCASVLQTAAHRAALSAQEGWDATG